MHQVHQAWDHSLCFQFFWGRIDPKYSEVIKTDQTSSNLIHGQSSYQKGTLSSRFFMIFGTLVSGAVPSESHAGGAVGPHAGSLQHFHKMGLH